MRGARIELRWCMRKKQKWMGGAAEMSGYLLCVGGAGESFG
jgi:hypothetical protein